MTRKHKAAENTLVEGKDALRDSIATSVFKEQQKAQDLHESDLAERKRQHELNMTEQKRHL